jgi:hypothetical protein
LKHVDGFFASNFANDDAVRSHSKRVHDEVSLPDCPLTFDIRRPRFEPDHVMLLETQFGGVFNSHDAFTVRNEGGKNVE